MANRFLHLEDNDDGTTTVTGYTGEEEFSFLLPFGLETFENMFPSDAVDETILKVRDTMITIPNDAEEA